MRRTAIIGVLAAAAAAIGAPGAMAASTLSGTAFYDGDEDGVIADDDTPIEGLRLFLDIDNDGGLDSAESVVATGPDGTFSFPGLGSGTRTFRVAPDAAQPPALRGLSCVAPASCAATTVLDGTSNSTFNFHMHFDGDDDDDRVREPEDCDDTDVKIKPGALEIRGNDVDENCDGVSLPFPVVDSSFTVRDRTTTVRRLNLTDGAEGAAAEVTCDGEGCPFAKYTMFLPTGDPVRFTPLFERRKLKAGTTITITVSAPGTIGRVITYKTRATKQPKVTLSCQVPGASDTIPCP